MHRLSVLIYGPNSFISTIDELKTYLKFNSSTDSSDVKHDVILYHEEALKNKKNYEFIMNSNSLKVCASNKKKNSRKFWRYSWTSIHIERNKFCHRKYCSQKKI